MAVLRAGRRSLRRLAATTVAALLAATAADAQVAPASSQTRAKPQSAAPVKRAPQAAAPVMSSGLTIARDADTGALRAPTESEAAELQAPAAPMPPVVEFVTPTGAIAAMVPPELLTYSVVSKNLDGSLSQICLPGAQAADTAVRAAARMAPNRVAAGAPAGRPTNPLRPAAGAPHE